jgi:hypothetical protein
VKNVDGKIVGTKIYRLQTEKFFLAVRRKVYLVKEEDRLRKYRQKVTKKFLKINLKSQN